MVKARFREAAVNDGDVIEFPNIMQASITIHVNSKRELKTVVTWLEQVKE